METSQASSEPNARTSELDQPQDEHPDAHQAAEDQMAENGDTHESRAPPAIGSTLPESQASNPQQYLDFEPAQQTPAAQFEVNGDSAQNETSRNAYYGTDSSSQRDGSHLRRHESPKDFRDEAEVEELPSDHHSTNDVPRTDAPASPLLPPGGLMRRLTRVVRPEGERWTLKKAARCIMLISRIVRTFTNNLKPYQYLCKKCKKLGLRHDKFIVSQHSSDSRDQAYNILLTESRPAEGAGIQSPSSLHMFSLGSLQSMKVGSRSRCPFCKLVVLSLEESDLKDVNEKAISKCVEDIEKSRKNLKECNNSISSLRVEIERCDDAIIGCQARLPSDKYRVKIAQYEREIHNLEAEIRLLEGQAEECLDDIALQEADMSRFEQHRDEIARARCYASFQMDGREVSRDPAGNVIDSRPRTRRIQLRWSDQRLPTSYIVLVAPESGAGYNPDQLHSWESSTSFLARTIGVANKNDARIRQWMDLCRDHHGELCNHEPGENFKAMISKAFFGVIDVAEMRLTALPPGSRYFALSYTWGEKILYTTTLQNVRLHQEAGGLDQVWQRLPKVVRDSIQLVRSLGERYLWVDSLCIVQKNDISWNLNSSVMDLVYGNAFVTICAAEGEGATTGLIALDPNRQVSQYIEECVHGLRLTVSHLAETYIEKSRWNTRGWTFQERLLSRRCIIFAGSRVFFQCRATAFSEDINGEHKSVGWSIELVRAPLRMLVDIETTAFAVFMECVRLYTRRNIGKLKDVLAAFRDTIAEILPNTSQWLAEHTWIQWYIRDGNGDLRPVWTMNQRSPKQNSTWTQSRWLGYGWYEGDTCDNYGRMVKMEYMFDGDKLLTKDHFTRTLPEYPFGISEASTSAEKDVTYPDQPILQFWTWTAHLRVTPRTSLNLSSSASSTSSIGETIDECPRVGNGLIRCDIEDYCGDWCGTIVLNADWLDDHMRFHPDENLVYEFIAISEAKNFSAEELDMWTYYVPRERDNADWDLFYVLLVTRKAGICYRQGLGKVFKEAFGKSYLPGKDWKEIIMG